ncbi:response regulator transcription factor [Paracoccus tegillarcae]|uniref:DNA-binding response regulator n=1 Tax=Paracoccus tegillarcae TaxID=1529068 RepID=A0A2K9EVT2_9RHOB|nr:response regulator transcription factor [Paracoccus tegillarcae]AUH33394.1 DNA-binding response regulator [Paracoccus tegillarcae]
MNAALIVDDHPITHLGAARLLRDLGYEQVHQAMTAQEALQEARNHRPGLIVLDITLPDGDGLSLVSQLLEAVPDARILVFSMNDQTSFAARALECGAHGFLSKNAPPEEFRQAVRAQEAGEFYLAPKHAIALATRGVNAADPLSQLTPRETEVLRLIGQGLSLQAIADDLGVSYKTVANASSALKRKLGVDGMNGLIRIAMEQPG